MKKTTNYLALTLLTALLFITSCKKEELLSKESAGQLDKAVAKEKRATVSGAWTASMVRREFDRILFERANDGYSLDDIRALPEYSLLRQDLGADDLTMIEIIMEVENTFGIEIPDEDAELLSTIKDFVDYILEELDDDLPPPTPEQLLESELNYIKGAEDSFYFGSVPSSSQSFFSVSAFNNYMNNLSYENSVLSDQGDVKAIEFKVTRGIATGEKIIVTIKKNSSNIWEYDDLTSDQWGAALFMSWTQHPNPGHIVNGDVITIDVYGTKNYNIIFENIGTVYSQKIHYRIKINKITGAPISIAKI